MWLGDALETCLWYNNVPVVSDISSIMNWSSWAPVMNKDMVWTSWADTKTFVWNVLSCPLLKSLVLSPLQGGDPEAWAHQQCLCAQRPHVGWGDGIKLLRAIRLLISDLRDSSTKSCFARYILLPSFLGPQFLISKMGRVALPYRLQSTEIGSGTADKHGWWENFEHHGRAHEYFLQLSRKMGLSSDMKMLGPGRITPICREQVRGRMGCSLQLGGPLKTT